MTIKIRRFIDNDLQTVLKLLNEDGKGGYEFYPYDEDRLRAWIQEVRLKILMAEDNGKALGSAAYSYGHWGEEIEWLIVNKGLRGKLVENMLLNKVEKFVHGGTVFTVVDADSHEIDEWVERGYRLEGGLYRLVAKLDSEMPIPDIPEDTVIRSLRKEEEEAFVKAVNIGFGTQRVAMGDVQRWKTESPPFEEEWIHVAVIDNRIVSVVVARPDTRYNKFFNEKRGYFGPAATLPEFRNKGLASTLARRAMNFLVQKGMNSVALHASEQNIPSITLFRKLGFQVGHHWRFMRKTV
jgi:ribosomal protein S18 acetylase RimI-like enzyme